MRYAVFFLSILITAQTAKAESITIACTSLPQWPVFKYEEGWFSDEVYHFVNGEWVEYCRKDEAKPNIKIKLLGNKTVNCFEETEDNVRFFTEFIDFRNAVLYYEHIQDKDTSWNETIKCMKVHD